MTVKTYGADAADILEPDESRAPATGAAAWGGVFALALSAFVLVASEFMPVSLLTQVATDLHVTEGQAGQSIAVSGAFALVTSLLISSLARGLDRKKLLLGLTLLMTISGTIAAFAPSYTMFMVARAFIGIAIGGFWSMSAAVAMRLVPADQVSKALAIVNGGNALATVVAAPLGSFLAAMVGWRGAFFFLIPVAIVALAWKLISLPAMPAGQPGRENNLLALLKRRPVVLGMAAVSVFFMGQFSLFTYLRPFLEAVTHTSASMTSLLLLIIGVAGFVGTILIGRVLKDHLYRTVILIPLAMAAIALALIAFGDSVATTAVLLGFWGLLATSAPVGWWTWLARTLPDDAEAGGGLLVGVVQLAIGTGAAAGGMLFDLFGYRATFGASAVILIAAAVLAIFAARAAGRSS
jgi:predicted MFS family arabinose efflux permease